MKRFFILATAAIVALAACVKSEVVYKDGPQQIAFKQVTGAMTKAPTDLATSVSLGVIAHAGADLYFDNSPFTYVTDGWVNANAFWPYEGALTFTVYAPAGTASFADNALTITGVTAADGLYYGTERITTTKVDVVPVLLKHVSAQITLNVDLGASYELDGADALTLTAPTTAGDVTVTYGEPVTVATATATTTTDLTLTSGTPVYVLPGAQTSIVVKFKQASAPYQAYEKEIALDENWVANTKYTYNIGITAPDQIKFSAEVDEWDGPETEGATLN